MEHFFGCFGVRCRLDINNGKEIVLFPRWEGGISWKWVIESHVNRL